MRPLLLEVLDSPVFDVILFSLFFALASLVVGIGWLIVYLFKLMGRRWSPLIETETSSTTASRVATLILLIPIGFLLITIVLAINKATCF